VLPAAIERIRRKLASTLEPSRRPASGFTKAEKPWVSKSGVRRRRVV
jgi:hypothetical protein